MPLKYCHLTVLYYVRRHYGGKNVLNKYLNKNKSDLFFFKKICTCFTFGQGKGVWKVNCQFTFLYLKKKLPSSISIDPNWQQRWLTPAFAYPVGPSLLGCLRRGQPNSRHQSDPCDVSIYLTLSCHQMIFIFSWF